MTAPRNTEPARTDRPGLSSDEAARRLAADGPNRLPTPRRPPAWRELADQMTHFFALMLWVAGAFAFVARLPQLGVAIFLVVIVNGLFAFAQQRSAERAAERLRDLLPTRALVLRDGHPIEIDAAEMVSGDLLLLSAGDRISADGTLIEVHGLRVDTAMLTGESVPASAEVGTLLFAGTFAVEGEGTAEVTATGSATRLGGIARLSESAARPPSPLARQLNSVVRTIAAVAVGVGLSFFGLSMLLGNRLADGFLFAVGVTVALVPEGLLPTVTLSLAVGARRMATQHALIRRLEAVATLGSTTFICTDKTGTLTRNEMAVVAAWTPGGEARIHGDGYSVDASIEATPQVRELLAVAAAIGRAASTGRLALVKDVLIPQGDPMEVALDVFARRVGLGAPDGRAPAERRFPFDPRRLLMSVVSCGEVLTKGAPEAVLDCCPGAERAAVEAAIHRFSERGLRTLAVARRQLAPGEALPERAADAEQNLELVAVLGLEDPPRPEARAALAACRVAGIRVAMLTGDHPATARAIAAEVGLLLPGSPDVVLIGSELPAEDKALGALMDHDGLVVARVSPEDKLRIARALRAQGHVVAMTGDGVNDGPALQEADIGIAMGRNGTDVAREAADLVLLDDNFATIISAVAHGRSTFANLRRFLTYHLTDNVAELAPFVVWALSGGRFPLAIGVLQVLCLDIGTDLLPALALGAEPPASDVLNRPPWQARLLDRRVLRRAFSVLGPTEAVVEMAAFVTGLWVAGWRPGDAFPTGQPLAAASGAAFAAVVIGQMANAFACRSSRHRPGKVGWGSNRLLLAAVLVELATLAGFLLIGPVARTLGHAWPPAVAGLVALTAAPAVLSVDAIDKWLHARKTAKASELHGEL